MPCSPPTGATDAACTAVQTIAAIATIKRAETKRCRVMEDSSGTSFGERSRSLRLDEPKRELVGGNLRVAGRLLAGIGRVAQEVALGFEDEAGLSHFREDDGLVDAVQRLPHRDIGSCFGRVIDHDEMPAGLQGGEQPLIHLGAVDGKISDVVVVENE